MAAENYNWDSRLCVMFKPDDGSSVLISPISTMEPTIDTPASIIDSIDGCNLGYSLENPRFTFNFEVQALNFSVFRKIYSCALNRTKFSIVMATLTNQPDSWWLDSIEFTDCMITNTAQTADSSNKVPTVKFQASCLNVNSSNNGEVVTTDKVGKASGALT